MHLSELKTHHVTELLEMANANGIDSANRMRKHDLIFAMLKNHAKKGESIFGEGTLEVLPDGFGFLRSPDTSYLAGTDDIYISPSQIRRFNLHTGDTIEGEIRTPKDGERYFALVKVDKVNGEPPENAKNKILFENLTPLFPDEACQARARHQGRGEHHRPHHRHHRADRQGPARAARVVAEIRQDGHAAAHRACDRGESPRRLLIVLLIDERPEEVTEMQRSVRGEVVASTFDEPATRHVQVAEMVIEKAKRLIEHKKDVVILLDSITRLARAYNTVVPASGKVLTGGVDANALQRPKRFFGAARNIEEGGSLTIIATALIDTGSHGRRDLRGIQGHRQHGDPPRPADGREADLPVDQREPLRHAARGAAAEADILQKVWVLRKLLYPMDELEAMEFLLDKIRRPRITPSSSTRCGADRSVCPPDKGGSEQGERGGLGFFEAPQDRRARLPQSPASPRRSSHAPHERPWLKVAPSSSHRIAVPVR